jgi:2-oxoglutarate dehydrogenase complex dehydrogenase (E1) component-like enzyme
MGGWTFMESRFENLMTACARARYIGRAASASPATGSYSIHQKEQAQLIQEALALES